MGLFSTTTTLEVNMVGTVFNTATNALASNMIDKAQNEIKKQLSKRYDISSAYFNTTTSIPPLLRTVCDELAEGYMYKKMARGSKEALARANEYINPAMENLKQLREGQVQLFDTVGSLITQEVGDWGVQCNTTDYNNTFNEDDPKSWRPDGDKLTDIADERD